MSKLLTRLALAGMFITTLAHADRPDYRPDGSVRFGSKLFPTTSAYFRSPEFRGTGARCGAQHQPIATQAIAPTDCDFNATMINPEYNDERVFVIQVVFHVIKKTDGTGEITPELLKSQIDILNEDFNAMAGTPGSMGTNAKFQFVLARKDPMGNPTPGFEVVTNDQYFADPGDPPNAMKQALHWDTTKYFNIYTNDAAGYLGYATFPQEEAGGPEDGVVLLWNAVGRNSPGGAPYDLGRTATHEVGHYLGLFHTFGDQDQCGTANAPYASGDLISDTPAERDPFFGDPACVAPRSMCPNNPGNDPIENYMDYSEDHCMTKFTPEQVNRMRCSIVNYRTINTAPTAGFTFTASTLGVTFTNTSSDLESGTTLEYSWNFGDGQTSTEANPTHTYAAAGSYNVTLEAYDPGSGTGKSMQMVALVSSPDAGPGAGGGDGGGCCQAPGGGSTFALLAAPVALVLRRRRRRGA